MSESAKRRCENPEWIASQIARGTQLDEAAVHHREQLGISVPRVLGREYLWFSGDGEKNYFRCEYDGERVMVDAEL